MLYGNRHSNPTRVGNVLQIGGKVAQQFKMLIIYLLCTETKDNVCLYHFKAFLTHQYVYCHIVAHYLIQIR